ncbi:MAG: hypothetical protein Q8N96_09990 [Methylovulum sp.]|nr:hypothetical protein [Methylovulum sp.]
MINKVKTSLLTNYQKMTSEWDFTIARTERTLSFSFFSKKEGQTEGRRSMSEPLAIARVMVKWLFE